MSITIYIAIYGAVISTIALGWNIYKQATSGPKLVGTIIPEANQFVPILRGVQNCIDLVVSNRGVAPTTITNVLVLSYATRLDRLRFKFVKQFPIKQSPPNYDLPYPIGPGNVFRCRLDMDAELMNCVRDYRTYLCIVHTMNSKPVHFRLRAVAAKPLQATL